MPATGMSATSCQGRYKAIPVEAANGYFLSLANYIHLNPARAGLVDLEKAQSGLLEVEQFPRVPEQREA